MNVEAILDSKGRHVITISAAATVQELAEALSVHRVGAMVVEGRRGEGSVGIVSERDLVHAVALHGPAALSLAVSEIMTADVKSCRLEDSIAELMTIMTRERVRHLPVVETGRMVGIVSIGDVVKYRLDEQAKEIDMWRELFTPAHY